MPDITLVVSVPFDKLRACPERSEWGERNQEVAHGELAEPQAQGERTIKTLITTEQNRGRLLPRP